MKRANMSESDRLIDELNRAIDGNPWHGDSIAKILDGVTVSQARAKPVARVHSIWEIVRHMTAWTNEVGRRLAGHSAKTPEEGDWPAPSGSDEVNWRKDVRSLFDAHQRVIVAVQAISDEALFEPTKDPRRRKTGTGVTRDVLLHGLAQHHAYHGGQISLLKKAGA